MTRFRDLLISDSGSIRDAMASIEANGREMVLVQDAAGCIVGLVTDGDIRRGLLAGRTMDGAAGEIMSRDFFSVGPDLDRAHVLDLMKARMFQHVPVLDGSRRLLGVHFLRDLLGTVSKPNIAVIMAGGRGTRLRPITQSIPKPMVEIAGRPLLERIILHLVGHGVTNIYLAVNYLAHIIENHFADGAAFGCQISYLRETTPLGTGGPLSLLEDRPKHPLIVLNGDQVMRTDLTAMLETHEVGKYVATIAAGTHQVEVPFATISQSGGRLGAIEEKPTLTMQVNRGTYILSPETLDLIPKGQEFPITGLFEMLLEKGLPVGVFHCEDEWVDVGRVEELNRANGRAPS